MLRVVELFSGVGTFSIALSYSDIDFDKAKKAGLSDSRLYKLAGNGIVLDVAKALLKELLDV